jgi:uncharacterized membrane protein
MTDLEPKLAEHVEKSARAIAEVHRDHDRRAGPVQRIVERVTALFARPATITFIAAVVALWVAWNGWVAGRGGRALDPPPFGWLELAATVAAFFLASLILATQRREDLIARQRAQLTLELALLSDQKTAKLIALMEEMRRDSPLIADRVDEESDAMSQPADAQSVLEAIERHALAVEEEDVEEPPSSTTPIA